MTNPTPAPGPTSEWLRPLSERLLEEHRESPPATVRVAAILSGISTVAAAGMVIIWGTMIADLLAERPGGYGNSLAVAVPLALTGAVLVAVFAGSTVMLSRRGWFRLPVAAGLVLGVLAITGVFLASVSSYVPAEPTPELTGEIAAASTTVLPWMAGTAVVAASLVVTVRTASASGWLANRRYQVRQGARSASQSGRDASAAYLRLRG